MVKGLDKFRSYFAGFKDCYVLIGGTACDLNFTSVALPFRATRDEEASSLSAILLDDTYYRFILDNRVFDDGVSFVSPVALIVLKAVAWLDLTDKREAGDAAVSARDVSKHKNDIARLVGLVLGQEPTIPPPIGVTMAKFLERYARETIDVASLGLAMTQAQILAELRRLFKQ